MTALLIMLPAGVLALFTFTVWAIQTSEL